MLNGINCAVELHASEAENEALRELGKKTLTLCRASSGTGAPVAQEWTIYRIELQVAWKDALLTREESE